MTVAIDIGSTMVKLVDLSTSPAQVESIPRDHEMGIAGQIGGLVQHRAAGRPVRICSSANGGLRAGILCLTRRFSGLTAQNLATAAGCNIVYLREYRAAAEKLPPVDVLICTGGAGGESNSRLSVALNDLDLSLMPHQALIWAGSDEGAEVLRRKKQDLVSVPAFLGTDLRLESKVLTSVLRELYLADLVHKEGIAALQPFSSVPIWPTPAVVNLAHQKITNGDSPVAFPAPFLLLDVGGATTDVHFGIEMAAQDMARVQDTFPDDCRWVFADLGVSASRESTIERLIRHPRLLDFLHAMAGDDAHQTLELLRSVPAGDPILFYACIFLALSALSEGIEPEVPHLALARAAALVITGGASQVCEPDVVASLFTVMSGRLHSGTTVVLDRDYAIWTIGIEAIPERDSAEVSPARARLGRRIGTDERYG